MNDADHQAMQETELTRLREVVERTADGKIPGRVVWYPGIAKSHRAYVGSKQIRVQLDSGYLDTSICYCYSTEELAETAREAAIATAKGERDA